jgi:hypothetical protein
MTRLRRCQPTTFTANGKQRSRIAALIGEAGDLSLGLADCCPGGRLCDNLARALRSSRVKIAAIFDCRFYFLISIAGDVINP